MSEKAVLLFDGVCNLCNGTVQSVLQRDKTDAFRFASLQSEYGQAVLNKHGLEATNFNTFVLKQGDRIYTRSTAAIRVLIKLGGIYQFAALFFLIPKFIRDWGYNLISKNRYRWFGKRESCWLPRPEWKDKFLDQ